MTLFSILVLLIALIAFFSGAETGIMSINRYRLKHLSQTSKSAKRVQSLLARPDRVLSVILLGNTLVIIFATSIRNILAVNFLRENFGFIAADILLTLAILIFGEVTPKTLAALSPEKVALPA